MAETRQQETPGSGEAGRDRGGRGPQEAQRAGAAALRQGNEAGAEAAQRSGQAASTALREGGEGGAETARRGGEAMAATTRRTTEEFAEGGRRIAGRAASEAEETAERYAEALRRMAQDVSRLMMVPRSAGDGLQEMQEAMGNLLNGMLRTNLRVTQEMMRRANPGAVVAEMQGVLIREYLDTVMESGTGVLRAARRTAEQALRPLEERMERGRDGEARQDGGGQEHGPRVAEVMSREVRVVNPEETVQQAARLMGEEDAGALPVGENDRLVGMVTDRDLAIRVLAEGKDPARTRVREVMTPETHYVFEDQGVDAVAERMRRQQLRRLPVLNRDKRLVGIVSIGDLARRAPGRPALGEALAGIAREGGRHDQSAERRQR